MLEADACEFGSEHLGGVAHVAAMLGRGRNRGDAQQSFELIEETRGVLAGVGKGGGRHELFAISSIQHFRGRTIDLSVSDKHIITNQAAKDREMSPDRSCTV
jgi:hypothetical protein